MWSPSPVLYKILRPCISSRSSARHSPHSPLVGSGGYQRPSKSYPLRNIMVKKADDSDEEVAFPPGIPRPHQVRDWCRYIEKRLTDLELTDVSNEEIPKGKFDLVWSKASLEPPPKLPAKASWAREPP